jgi:small conductance mechanosensitive channel
LKDRGIDWLASLSQTQVWWASGLRVLAIVVAAWLAIALLQRGIRRLRERIASRLDDREAVLRAATLGRVLRYVVAVVVSLLAGMLVLSELGVSVAPILGAAGVVGLAVGFGAQSLVKDYFTGLFLLLEDQIHQGDVVRLGEHAGLVEEMTLRYVRLRDYDGHVHFVPNGQIAAVVNLSRGHAQAVIDAGVAYGTELQHAMDVMSQTAQCMRDDVVFGPKILAAFEMVGVERWDDSAVVLRGRFKVAPLEQWSVRREYLRRLKAAFDAAGIEIPFPQLAVHLPRRAVARSRRTRKELT